MLDIQSSENSGHLTATRHGKQEDHPLQIYSVHEKLLPENAKIRHALSTRINNTKMYIIKISWLIIYTELDFLKRGSNDWVLWTLKPEGYINLCKSLTSSVS